MSQLADAEDLEVVVIGAGPAGLAVAGELAARGVRAVLVEAGESPGWAWRRHYPWLRLHTTRRDSSLPGWPLPREGERYPGRDEYAGYLAAYAARIGAEVRTRSAVRAVRRRRGGGWDVETAAGPLYARQVVVAAGFNRLPDRPRLPAEERFGGPVLHSSQWRLLLEPSVAMAGRRVLVAGLGNTGADLVAELHRGGAEVAVAVRGPVHLVPRELLGVSWRTWYRLLPGAAFALGRLGGPVRWVAKRLAGAFWSAVQNLSFGDLRQRGLRLQGGSALVRHWRSARPPLTSGPFVDLLRSGEVRVLPALVALHPGEAELADGDRYPCAAVVLATGFRPGLEELLEPAVAVRCGSVPPDGRPTGFPGLWFCGYLPELIRIRRAARRIARAVAADLRRG